MLARVDDVAGYGWQAWPGAGRRRRAGRGHGRCGSSNGLVTVAGRPARRARSPSTATRGLGALVDGGDVGDTYNWCPPDDGDARRLAPLSVTTPGARARPAARPLEVIRTLRAADPRRRTSAASGRTRSRCATILELRAGEDLVRVHVELRQPRPAGPPPARAPPAARTRPASRAPSARSPSWSAASRPRAAPPRWACRPSRRAASCRPAGSPSPTRACSSTSWSTSPATTAPHTLAVTLLRCTGMLSQGPMATRPLPGRAAHADGGAAAAGPVSAPLRRPRRRAATPTPWSTTPTSRSWSPAAVAPATGPPTGQALADRRGRGVSAVVREAGALHVRVFNPTDAADHGHHRRPPAAGSSTSEAARCEPFEGSFELDRGQIATAALA